jgi:HD-like signal output (HDOD) protein/CheY-like chemotaxis protein
VKVLFVDDEEAILSGLRRMLRRHAADWETSFAVGGEAALACLRDEQFDVVVTDMRMPGLDGAGVLDAVRRQQPGTVRIVLSGHNEMASALRTVPLAHQFLTKPCDPEELRAAVNRATRLQQVLTRTELLPVIGGVDTLPSPPAVITRLGSLLGSAEVDIDEVVEVVSADAAISAKLLQLVNSAFFGVARRVGDVGTAVRYLGIVTVRDLAVAVHAFRSMTTGSAKSLITDIHTHSSQVADLTQLLVGDGRHRHEAYVAALLHDVGRLVLAARATDAYTAVVAEAAAGERSLRELESEAFGADHTQVGALFLSMWGLPYPIVEVVLSHHEARCPADPLSAPDATYLAEALRHSMPDDERAPGGDGESDPIPDEVRARPAVARALQAWTGADTPS